MTAAEIILTVLVAAVVVAELNAQRRHREIVDLLNDFATMVGELLERRS